MFDSCVYIERILRCLKVNFVNSSASPQEKRVANLKITIHTGCSACETMKQDQTTKIQYILYPWSFIP